MFQAAWDSFDPLQRTTHFYRLSDNNSIASQIKRFTNGVALLNKVVHSGIHRWKFKLIEFNDTNAYIGVFKAQTQPKFDDNPYLDDGHYRGKSYAIDLYYAKTTCGDTQAHDYGVRCKKGDVIEMALDLHKLELRYNIKGKDYGAAFQNIEQTSYRACVCGANIGASYKLLSYSTIEEKQEEKSNKLQQQIQELKEEISLKTAMNISLKEQNEQKDREIESWKSKYQHIQTESRQEIQQLQAQNKSLNENNANLNEECKELQIEIKEIKDKYNKLEENEDC